MQEDIYNMVLRTHWHFIKLLKKTLAIMQFSVFFQPGRTWYDLWALSHLENYRDIHLETLFNRFYFYPTKTTVRLMSALYHVRFFLKRFAAISTWTSFRVMQYVACFVMGVIKYTFACYSDVQIEEIFLKKMIFLFNKNHNKIIQFIDVIDANWINLYIDWNRTCLRERKLFWRKNL